MKLTEQYDGHMFRHPWKMLSRIVRTNQHGTIRYIRALQGHSHGVAINPNFVLIRFRCSISKRNITCACASVTTNGRETN